MLGHSAPGGRVRRLLPPRRPRLLASTANSTALHPRRSLCQLSALLRLTSPDQLRQPRDVGGDPPRLVGRQCLRLMGLGRIDARIDVRQRLAGGVADDVATVAYVARLM
jgi:hypothetical protein